jgi:hypothetical protein
MNELVAAVAAWSPETVLAGAQAEAIDALARAAPQPLPPDYVDFLATAAETPGNLFAPRHDLSVEALLQFHRAGDWKPPAGYLAIGVDDSGMDTDLYLDLGSNAVVELERWADGVAPLVDYASLAAMLFTQAFYNLRMPQFVRRARFVQNGPGAGLDALAHLALELELLPVPYTGGWTLCYDSSDLGLMAYEPPGRGLFLEAAAADDVRLLSLQRVLERLLHVVMV